jgi:hypothetical protein
MTDTILEGKVTFVQYEKKFITIDYVSNGKSKSVNGSIKDADQQHLIDQKLIKKFHYFREGDEVKFVLARSVRGDKMVATRIQFMFNNALSNLLHRASISNQFTGYLKQVEDEYFIKEINSYLFFPLKLATYEKRPFASTLNEPVQFSLENITNPDKVTAVLMRKQFIPEFNKAQMYFDNETVIDSKVSKVTPHAIHVSVVGEVITARLPIIEGESPNEKPGDQIKIIITFLSADKIAVKRAE